MEEEKGHTSGSSGRNDYFLGVSILLAAVIIGGAIVYSIQNGGIPSAGNVPGGNGGALATKAPALTAGDVILGDPNAPVTLLEYGDFQCPFCGRFFTDTKPKVVENYVNTGKVKLVYRNFAFLGVESTMAAESAHCAAEQGKFWEYHDALYGAEIKDGRENNGNLNEALFSQLAQDVGLNVPQFTSCIDSGKFTSVVTEEKTDAGKYGVNSTPSFFVNDTPIQGALPYDVFQAAIEAELKK